ncbi:Maf family protein [Candidatus Nitrosacidococcus sp. I8]|uniref:Maf family protein n=1 Tax=Candidatus Nitrosacidococcus sp. I8 TaxID=2942908 RepID=UPI002226C599|nr:Maf family nucleotide pyrophosphatase [Candidatus Nitrosacidococcus sp. I8]CAH9018699.1 7-methyl-GTP pyrophosphatase [Candidatus Nitrosacidococcus sp. I8]
MAIFNAYPPLILASSSPYRAALLKRLNIPFKCYSPHIDETPLPQETPQQLSGRLAQQKAQVVREQFPQGLIIGSDQVASIDEKILGKPETHERAVTQLKAATGKKMIFYTGLCLLNGKTGQMELIIEPFCVYFRSLTQEQIENYLQQEQPYDCAGSFKAEGLGIALFDRLEGSDPNALIGLPLIQLVTLLNKMGYPIL